MNGRRHGLAQRIWIMPAVMLAVTTAIFFGGTIQTFYETHINQTPLLEYDYHGSDGMPTDHQVYRAGEAVELAISRCVRVAGQLSNQLYLSTSTRPIGTRLAVLESSAAAGCSSRIAEVATIPGDTRPGAYRLAGAQTITTKYGTLIVYWYSTPFYVIGA